MLIIMCECFCVCLDVHSVLLYTGHSSGISGGPDYGIDAGNEGDLKKDLEERVSCTSVHYSLTAVLTDPHTFLLSHSPSFSPPLSLSLYLSISLYQKDILVEVLDHINEERDRNNQKKEREASLSKESKHEAIKMLVFVRFYIITY